MLSSNAKNVFITHTQTDMYTDSVFASSTLYPQRSTRQQSVPGWHTCLTTRQVSARPMAPSASLYFCSHIYLATRTHIHVQISCRPAQTQALRSRSQARQRCSTCTSTATCTHAYIHVRSARRRIKDVHVYVSGLVPFFFFFCVQIKELNASTAGVASLRATVGEPPYGRFPTRVFSPFLVTFFVFF